MLFTGCAYFLYVGSLLALAQKHFLHLAINNALFYGFDLGFLVHPIILALSLSLLSDLLHALRSNSCYLRS